ncbi:DUF1206 domain-containing protein (plasmid) [Coraliomargarita sp. W4R53]
MSSDAKDLAREVESSSTVRRVARTGYAANGVVHILIGIIVLIVAFGGDAESSQAGAFKAIASAPLGFVALWILAIALWTLGLWHTIDGLLAHGETTLKKWGQRLSHWGQALVFITIGLISAAVALGARPDGDQTAETASGTLLALPGGLFVLGAIGLGVGIAGVSFIAIGIRRGFRKKMNIPDDKFGHAIVVLGLVGYIAKGVALVIIGGLLIVAAIRVDPETASGLDAAMQRLLGVQFGPALVAIVGAGLVAYGIFCVLRTRYADL